MKIRETPWDKRTFGFPTYEIPYYTEGLLTECSKMKGHFTLKIDPLEDKRLLNKYGFYYVDTLMEPYCIKDKFKSYYDEKISLDNYYDLSKLKACCSNNTFQHARFHKDFRIDNKLADERYERWLEDLYNDHKAFALLYNNDLAGFFCIVQNKIPLHALNLNYRGKGLAKYFWSAAINHIFNQGHHEISSSVSASNLAVINLYISLGFNFRSVVDVYHKFNV